MRVSIEIGVACGTDNLYKSDLVCRISHALCHHSQRSVAPTACAKGTSRNHVAQPGGFAYATTSHTAGVAGDLSCAQPEQRNTCPPSAALWHCSIADMTFSCPSLSCTACRHTGPWARQTSATWGTEHSAGYVLCRFSSQPCKKVPPQQSGAMLERYCQCAIRVAKVARYPDRLTGRTRHSQVNSNQLPLAGWSIRPPLPPDLKASYCRYPPASRAA